jgi:hypothetical protein
LLISFTSCASIFTGSKRNVFETDPPGAKVFVNGFEKGTTSSIKVKANDRVDFKLDNYKEIGCNGFKI